MLLDIDFFIFLQFGVYWASWICMIVTFITAGKLSAVFFFSDAQSLFSLELPCQNTEPFVTVYKSPRPCLFLFGPLCCSDWICSSWSLLSLSSPFWPRVFPILCCGPKMSTWLFFIYSVLCLVFVFFHLFSNVNPYLSDILVITA